MIHVDGGARGNPGPAGAGVVIASEQGDPLFEAAYFLGQQTNNAAEYHALIRALQRAADFDPTNVKIRSDSELLVRQVTGAYQVKSPKLAQLYEQVQFLLLKMRRWSIQHVRREENGRADNLANLAMDRRTDVIVHDAAGRSNAAQEPPAPGDKPAEDELLGATAPAPARPAVRVTVARAPAATQCPAGGFAAQTLTIESALPADLCVHAAHALLPTVLAILNTDPNEVSAVPTMTVRCTRPDCRAEFQLTPVPASNGRTSREEPDAAD